MGSLGTDPSRVTSTLPLSPSATPLKKVLQLRSCFHPGIATHDCAFLLLCFPFTRAELMLLIEGEKTNEFRSWLVQSLFLAAVFILCKNWVQRRGGCVEQPLLYPGAGQQSPVSLGPLALSLTFYNSFGADGESLFSGLLMYFPHWPLAARKHELKFFILRTQFPMSFNYLQCALFCGPGFCSSLLQTPFKYVKLWKQWWLQGAPADVT